jgi:hypothetical protein
MEGLNEYVQAGELLPWIILLPLLGAVINGIFAKGADKSLITGVSVGSVFLSFLLALFCFGKLLGTEGAEEHVDTVYEWFRIGAPGGFGGTFEIPVRVRFVMDHLSGIMTVMVTGIASLIHLYSTGYMGEDPGYRRFMTLPEPVHGLDARARPGIERPLDVRRLGGRRPLQLPPHRLLVGEPRVRRGRPQGLRREPHR